MDVVGTKARRGSILQSARLSSALASGMLALTANGAEPELGVGASFTHDGNISRSASTTRVSDNILGLRVFQDMPLGKDTGDWTARVGANANLYLGYSDLSHAAASAALDRQWWDLLPIDETFVDVLLSAQVRQYANSTIRNGLLLSAGGRVGKAFGTAANIAMGLHWDRRVAWEGEVYDLSNWRWQFDLEGRPAETAVVYASAAWISGQDVFTIASPTVSSSRGRGQNAADSAISRSGLEFTAFRSDATARTLDLGVQFATGRDGTLNLQFTRYSADGDAGLGYTGQAWSASYVHRFR